MHCCATSLLTGQFWLYLRILKRRPSVIAKPSAMTKKPDQAFAFMTSPRNRCPRVIATGGINKVKSKRLVAPDKRQQKQHRPCCHIHVKGIV